MHKLKVDQEFVEFEQWVKVHGEFGENTLGVNQVAQERVQLTNISMQDMLDIEAGAKVLYIFMIVKYKDDKHPEGLESKSCTTYRRGIIEACDGHNDVP
jgi:hypothetical protein